MQHNEGWVTQYDAKSIKVFTVVFIHIYAFYVEIISMCILWHSDWLVLFIFLFTWLNPSNDL